jgi:hypothetical protein
MSFHDESQMEFTYGRSRQQRRMLVALMWIGTLLPSIGLNLNRRLMVFYADTIISILVFGGLLISLTCYYVLYYTMKDISEKPPEKLDERQTLVSGRAYRQAFNITMRVVPLALLLQKSSWLSGMDLTFVAIWLLMIPRSVPMSIMAWTEPD